MSIIMVSSVSTIASSVIVTDIFALVDPAGIVNELPGNE